MKYLLSIFIVLVLFYSIQAQTRADNISDAILLTSTTNSFSDAIGAGSEYLSDACYLNGALRIWFKFKPSETGSLTLTVDNEGYGGFLYTSSNGLSAQSVSDLNTSSCQSGLTLNITQNTNYYLAIHSTSSTKSFTVTINSNVPLPVELINFEATQNSGVVTLNWKTATEVNNYGFEIERASSHNNETSPFQEWETIGFVEGSGNSNSPKNYSFVDENLPANLQANYELEYRLKQIDTDGAFKYYSTTTMVDLSSITSISFNNLPTEFSLGQNYPNPFNPSTNIDYNLATPSFVQLNIFDLQGRKIDLLVNEFQLSGNYQINYRAKSLSSGIYFYQLNAMDKNKNILFSDCKKMLLIK